VKGIGSRNCWGIRGRWIGRSGLLICVADRCFLLGVVGGIIATSGRIRVGIGVVGGVRIGWIGAGMIAVWAWRRVIGGVHWIIGVGIPLIG